MTTYDYTKYPVSIGSLRLEIEAEYGITTPLDHITFKGPDNLFVTFSGSLTGEETSLLDAVISGHMGIHPPEPAQLPTADMEAGQFLLTDGAGRSVWASGFPSTVAGVCPENDNDLAIKEYVDTAITTHTHLGAMNWSMFPTFNGPVGLLGWHIKIDEDAALSNTPLTTPEPAYNSHIVLDISSVSSTPCTITVSGLSISEDSGESMYAGENITVSGTGYYQTTLSFVDDPQIFVIESGEICICDIYKTSYWDNANSDFTLEGIRLEWTPDATTWHMGLIIYEVLEDGSLYAVDDVYFSNVDEIKRADKAKVGKYRRTDYNYFIKGSNNRGLVIRMNQFAMYNFNLYLQYLT